MLVNQAQASVGGRQITVWQHGVESYEVEVLDAQGEIERQHWCPNRFTAMCNFVDEVARYTLNARVVRAGLATH